MAATDAMDEPTAEINLAVIDSTAMMDAAAMDVAATDAATDAMDAPAMDAAAMDAAAMDVATEAMDASTAAMDAAAMDAAAMDAMDAPTVVIDSAVMDAAAMDAAAMDAATEAMDAATEAMDASMVLMEDLAAAMDAVDVVVGALPLLPKHVVRLVATMYPPTKTSSATQAIDTTATGWRTNLSTSMSFPQWQRVLPASPHHRPGVPLALASPHHQLHAWLIGPA